MITPSEVLSYFTLVKSDPVSKCAIRSFSLYTDQAGTTAWTDPKVKIDTTATPSGSIYPIAIDRSEQFEAKDVWLIAKTDGLKTAEILLKIDVYISFHPCQLKAP